MLEISRANVLTLNCGRRTAAYVERRAACGASYNACASGATPRKFETRQPARPAGHATADRQFQRRVRRPAYAGSGSLVQTFVIGLSYFGRMKHRLSRLRHLLAMHDPGITLRGRT